MPFPPDFSPRYSFGSWAFSFGPFAAAPWSFERVCEYTAAAGYHGIEINGFRPHPHPQVYDTVGKCRELAKFIDGLGLGIAAYAPDFGGVSPVEDDCGKYLAEMENALRFCERLGIKILRVDTVTPPDGVSKGDESASWERLVKNWRAAAQACQNSGVTLVWEFEPGFWLNKPSEVIGLAVAVDHPSFRVLFDTSHAYMCAVVGARHGANREILPGGVAEFAQLARPHIGHLHFIDSDGRLHDEETSIHAPFGAGKIDFPGVVDALGPAVWELEWLGVDFCFCPTTERDAELAIPFLNQLLSPVR